MVTFTCWFLGSYSRLLLICMFCFFCLVVCWWFVLCCFVFLGFGLDWMLFVFGYLRVLRWVLLCLILPLCFWFALIGCLIGFVLLFAGFVDVVRCGILCFVWDSCFSGYSVWVVVWFDLVLEFPLLCLIWWLFILKLLVVFGLFELFACWVESVLFVLV